MAAQALPVVLAVVVAVVLHRGAPRSVESWAASRGLELREDNRAMVLAHLRVSRTLRALGVAAGFLLAPLLRAALGSDPGVWVPDANVAPAVGYGLGAVYAEVALRRQGSGRALLRRRRVRDYLSPPARRAQRRTAAAAVAVGVAAIVVPHREPLVLSEAEQATTLVGALVVLVVVEGVQRWLVRRPSVATSASVLQADDAIRTQSVHTLSGTGAALHWLLVGSGLWNLAMSDVQLLRWTAWVPAMLAIPMALWACGRYEAGEWQVRRRPTPGPAPC